MFFCSVKYRCTAYVYISWSIFVRTKLHTIYAWKGNDFSDLIKTPHKKIFYFTSHDYVEYIHIWLRLLHYGLWLPLHELIVLLSLLNATFGIKHLLFLWVEISLSTRSCCDDRNCFKVNRTSVNLWTCLRCPRSKEKLIFLHHFFFIYLLITTHPAQNKLYFMSCAHFLFSHIYIYIYIILEAHLYLKPHMLTHLQLLVGNRQLICQEPEHRMSLPTTN